MTEQPHVSVVVPMMNEEANVAPLVDAVRDALPESMTWELILVDDGSRDQTREIGAALSVEDPRVRLVALARNYGQSTAMQAGFDCARGSVVVTMDGDLQNDPRDIPLLLEKLDEGFDLVAGYRIRRQDRFFTRKVPSWVANRIIRWITGVAIRDNGCSLKAYRRELLSGMRLYSEMHRFIPALAAATAGARITEVGVRHHARTRGESKYGLSRIFRVLADLMSIKMIRSFRLRPLVLFAALAAGSAILGALSGAASLVAIFTFQPTDAASMVFPGIALLWFALSLFLLMLGLVGEGVIRQHRVRGLRIVPLTRMRSFQ
ncbi:MAG: glycosyltransferase family 2 protein [Gemmatimonadetes bacterium]|nr:glycosyltransferase family 2 protein [Gemmatimonadota bacterium]